MSASIAPSVAVAPTGLQVPSSSAPDLDAAIDAHVPTAVTSGDAGQSLDAGMRAAQALYWLDVSGKVLSSSVERFAPRTLVAAAGQGPDGIAVDVRAGYIYWTDMGVPADDDGSLMRARLDGSEVTTLIPAGGTYTPKQLKLNGAGTQLYWSDREGMRVQRANVDGTQLETLYVAGNGARARQDLSNHCVGIALDEASGYFYWSQKGPSNGGVGSLRRAHLTLPAGEDAETRTDVEILYEGLPEPIDIDLDLAHGNIYWTDRGDDTVNRGPIELPLGTSAAERDDREILVHDVPEAIGIALDVPNGVVYYTDAEGDVGRAWLDGDDNEWLLTDSGAFTGIVVVDR